MGKIEKSSLKVLHFYPFVNWSTKAVLRDPISHELLEESSFASAKAWLLMCKQI